MNEFENENKNVDESTFLNNDTDNITMETVDELNSDTSATDTDISPETIKSESTDTDTEPKVKKTFRRTVALGLSGAILSGASLGFCFGVGLNASKNLFSETRLPFSFDQIKSEDSSTDVQATALNLDPSESSISATINSVEHSVVNISITAQSATFFNQVYESTGSGSGIIYSEDNEKVYIVTNNHVVDGASSVTIAIDGDEQIDAKLVGKDASSDLAVISVLKSDLKSAGIESVKVANFGDSDSLEVGEYVIAIGNALGQGKTATRGIISALNKDINIDGNTLNVLQTDAAINPGNSGGALVNTNGEVIGINTAKTASSSIEGTGYAIPINNAQTIISQLMENGTVDKPYLGITGYTITEEFKQMYNINIDGIFVGGIASGSGAEKAGLQVSDIITSINGQKLTESNQLSDFISKCKSGDTVTLEIIRNGHQSMTVTATLSNLNETFN